jgi:hypothetical protein
MSTKNERITTRGGTAVYVVAANEPPAYLIDAIPGAREAYDRWQAENEAGRNSVTKLAAAQRAVPATRWIGSAAGDDLRRVPNGDTTQAELDEALLVVREAERAVAAQSRRARAALAAFDALYIGAASAVETRRVAAEHALAKQAEAEAAWETLQAALAERNDAAHRAGAPIEQMGRTPVDASGPRSEAIHKPGALTDRSLPTSSEFQVAERTVSASVDRFRIDVLEAIAKKAN